MANVAGSMDLVQTCCGARGRIVSRHFGFRGKTLTQNPSCVETGRNKQSVFCQPGPIVPQSSTDTCHPNFPIPSFEAWAVIIQGGDAGERLRGKGSRREILSRGGVRRRRARPGFPAGRTVLPDDPDPPRDTDVPIISSGNSFIFNQMITGARYSPIVSRTPTRPSQVSRVIL